MDPIQDPKPQIDDSESFEHDGQRPQASPEDLARIQRHLEIKTNFERGVGNFTSVAVLSLINTALIYSQASINFVGVLGVTKIADYIVLALAQEFGSFFFALGLCFDLLAAGLFFGIAALARRHHRWAIYAGMLIYVLDGGVSLYIGDNLEVAFHAFLLMGMYGTLAASKELEDLALAGD